MGLEAATYVDDLVSTNPLGTDTIPQGDDHLRLIKAALKATFKGFSRAFYAPTTAASQTSTVTVATTDQNKLFPVDASSGGITVDLPQGSTLPDGFEVEIVKTDHTTNLVTIDGYSAETINGYTTYTLWQSYQTMKLRYSSALSAWVAKREYIPPKGEITPWISASAVPEGGFLFPNGQTIGDASSSGSARANADCQGLFLLLYAQFSNTVCPVSSGRGASGAADWAAHKNIGLPNLAGRTWIGLDNLGGISDAGVLTATANGANTAGQTNGEAIGNESITLTVAKLPASGVAFTTNSGGVDHTHTLPNSNGGSSFVNNTILFTNPGGTLINSSNVTGGASAYLHTHTGTTNNLGSGDPHTLVQPSFVSAWKIKI